MGTVPLSPVVQRFDIADGDCPFFQRAGRAMPPGRSPYRTAGAPARGRRRGVTMLDVLVAMILICTLAAILLPAVQQAREVARRVSCRNNLMQIGLALRNYESAHEVLPQGSVNASRPIRYVARGYQVGWIVRILPYLDQRARFEQFNFTVGIHDVNNAAVVSTNIPVLNCPSSWGGSTCYAGCHHDVEAPIDVDNSGVLILNRCISQDDIEDGVSHTIFVGEKADRGRFGWQSGTSDSLRNTGTPIVSGQASLPGSQPSSFGPDSDVLYVGGFNSQHACGAHFLFGDGAVRFLASNISMSVYGQLGHRADHLLPSEDF